MYIYIIIFIGNIDKQVSMTLQLKKMLSLK